MMNDEWLFDKKVVNLTSVHDKKECDTMGERIGRIRTDFFRALFPKFEQKNQEKSV
jgi:hypothetical protein